MKGKQNKIGQTLGIGIGAMLLAGLLSCAITAFLIGKETISSTMGTMICWILSALSAYAVSWYIAKRSEKNKMQMAAAVVGVYVCICILMGRALFSGLELKVSVWMVILMGAAALGGITSCVKKERKR